MDGGPARSIWAPTARSTPGLIQLRNGVWRMFFKDERKKMMLSYAGQPRPVPVASQRQRPSRTATARGRSRFTGRASTGWWRTSGPGRACGVRDDARHWKPQQGVLPGKPRRRRGQRRPGLFLLLRAPRSGSSRTVPINVVELNVVNRQPCPAGFERADLHQSQTPSARPEK